MEIFNIIKYSFLPEFTILIFIAINTFLAIFGKEQRYKKAKIISFAAIILSAISIFYTQISMQSSASTDTFITNIFTITFKTFILIASFFVITASHNLIRENRKHPYEFFTYFLIGIFSGFMLISSNNLLCAIIAILLNDIACNKLIAARKNNVSKELSTKYLFNSIISNSMLIIGSIMLYNLFGSLNINSINANTDLFSQNIIFICSGLLILFSVLIKLGVTPFFNNIFDVQRKTSSGISIYLSLIPLITYCAFISRIFIFIYDENIILQITTILISVMTIVIAVLRTIKEINIKRIYTLLYQINASLLIIAICSTNVYSLSFAILGLFTYIFINSGLWSAAIIIRTRFQSEDINSYAGLFKQRPYMSMAYIICLLAIAGLPPTAGFIVKLYNFFALFRINIIYIVALGIILFIMPLSLIVFFRIIKTIFKKQNNNNIIGSRIFLIPKITLYICAISLLLMFIFPENLIKAAQIIAYYI